MSCQGRNHVYMYKLGADVLCGGGIKVFVFSVDARDCVLKEEEECLRIPWAG